MSITSQILSQKPAQMGCTGVTTTPNQHGRIDIFNQLECQQGLTSQFSFHDFSCNRGCYVLPDLLRTMKWTERITMSMISRYILPVYMGLNINLLRMMKRWYCSLILEISFVSLSHIRWRGWRGWM